MLHDRSINTSVNNKYECSVYINNCIESNYLKLFILDWLIFIDNSPGDLFGRVGIILFFVSEVVMTDWIISTHISTLYIPK